MADSQQTKASEPDRDASAHPGSSSSHPDRLEPARAAPVDPISPSPLLHSLLSRPILLTLPDRRTLLGLVSSLDNSSILLTNTIEYLPPPRNEEEWEIRRNRDMYWPRSERYQPDLPHPLDEDIIATGSSGEDLARAREARGPGRELGMTLIKMSDVVCAQMAEKEWEGMIRASEVV